MNEQRQAVLFLFVLITMVSAFFGTLTTIQVLHHVRRENETIRALRVQLARAEADVRAEDAALMEQGKEVNALSEALDEALTQLEAAKKGRRI